MARPDGKPKRCLTAYNIFFQHERQRLLAALPPRDNVKSKKAHGKIGFSELGKTISQNWKRVTAAQKAYYRDLAKQDKQRYLQEMEEWKAQLAHQQDDDDDIMETVTGANVGTTTSFSSVLNCSNNGNATTTTTIPTRTFTRRTRRSAAAEAASLRAPPPMDASNLVSSVPLLYQQRTAEANSVEEVDPTTITTAEIDEALDVMNPTISRPKQQQPQVQQQQPPPEDLLLTLPSEALVDIVTGVDNGLATTTTPDGGSFTFDMTTAGMPPPPTTTTTTNWNPPYHQHGNQDDPLVVSEDSSESAGSFEHQYSSSPSSLENDHTSNTNLNTPMTSAAHTARTAAAVVAESLDLDCQDFLFDAFA